MSGKYDDAIRRAAESGMSYGEAAGAIGANPAYLSVRAKHLGVKLRDRRGVPMRGRKNVERIARIRELAAQGLSQSTIAAQEGISRERVRQFCNREGIDTISGRQDLDLRDRIAELASEGLTTTEIAHRLERKPSAVSAAAKSIGISLPRPEKPSPVAEQIRQMAADGMTRREAAEALGRNYASVAAYAWQLGIRFVDGRSVRASA